MQDETALSAMTDKMDLLTLLDSNIPESLAIKRAQISKNTKIVIADTVIRNNFRNNRFLKFHAKNGKIIWSSRKHITSPGWGLLQKAGSIWQYHQDALKDSYLTSYEINKIIAQKNLTRSSN